MTSNDRKYAIENVEGQLKYNYLDIGCHGENEIEVVKEAMSALKVLEQIKWERDVALSQLNKLGLSLGQNVDDVKGAIEFKKYFDELYGEGLEVANWHLNGDLEPFDNFYENALQNGN